MTKTIESFIEKIEPEVMQIDVEKYKGETYYTIKTDTDLDDVRVKNFGKLAETVVKYVERRFDSFSERLPWEIQISIPARKSLGSSEVNVLERVVKMYNRLLYAKQILKHS